MLEYSNANPLARNISKMSCIFWSTIYRSLRVELRNARTMFHSLRHFWGRDSAELFGLWSLHAFNNTKRRQQTQWPHWLNSQLTGWHSERKNIVKIQQHFWIYSALIAAKQQTAVGDLAEWVALPLGGGLAFQIVMEIEMQMHGMTFTSASAAAETSDKSQDRPCQKLHNKMLQVNTRGEEQKKGF